MSAAYENVCVARVLHEDEAFMTLEVLKDDEREITVQPDDNFLTLVFIREVEGRPKAWRPWVED